MVCKAGAVDTKAIFAFVVKGGSSNICKNKKVPSSLSGKKELFIYKLATAPGGAGTTPSGNLIISASRCFTMSISISPRWAIPYKMGMASKWLRAGW